MRTKVKIRFPLGVLSLVIPSKWDLGMIEKIAPKLRLNKYLCAKFMVYYAQSNYNIDDRFTFKAINTLDYRDITRVLQELVNADREFLVEVNAGVKFRDAQEAYEGIKLHLEEWSKKTGSLMMGAFFVVSVVWAHVKALQGELSEKDTDQMRQMASVYKQVHPYIETLIDENQRLNASKLLEFCDKQEEYILLWNTLSANFRKIRSSGLWISSRYAEEISAALTDPGIVNFKKAQIDQLVLGHLKTEDLDGILSDWKRCSLFKGRVGIIDQAFRAHRGGLYAPAITCFLTQADYILLKIAKYINLGETARNTNRETIESIAGFIEDHIIMRLTESEFLPIRGDLSAPIYFFQKKTLAQYLRQIVFEDTTKIATSEDELNRHGILHGLFMGYPTEVNSKKIILLIDDLIDFYYRLPEHVKEIHEP